MSVFRSRPCLLRWFSINFSDFFKKYIDRLLKFVYNMYYNGEIRNDRGGAVVVLLLARGTAEIGAIELLLRRRGRAFYASGIRFAHLLKSLAGMRDLVLSP